MLDDYKLMFKKEADGSLPQGWEKQSKNDLCNLYIDNEHNNKLKDAYYCAIIYKYWNLIQKFHSLSYNVCSPEDVYEWLLSSVNYALKHRSWKRETSSIYNDPNGPDKVINRCMKCRRLTYYQAINRKKRKNGNLMLSLDKMKEDFNDNTDNFEDVDASLDDSSVALYSFIKQLYHSENSFTAFVVDLICFANDVFDEELDENDNIQNKFNVRKLTRILLDIDEIYLQTFSTKYELDYADVSNTWNNKYRFKDADHYEQLILQSFTALSKNNYLTDAHSGGTNEDYLQTLFIKEIKENKKDGYKGEELW